tara:strand:+ start:110 stop:1111 length:1002 start_codon:yes stop_codon:yes gene_type:complete
MIEFENTFIRGISTCVPSKETTVDTNFLKKSKKEIENIIKTTGIKKLRMVNKEINSSDLCIESSESLFHFLDFDRIEIDALIFVSQTRDYIMPQTSNLIRRKLNLRKDVICYDLPLGCTGFVQGLFQAKVLLQNKKINNVLLLCGDTITKYINNDDHSTRSVFGDASSSSIISFSEKTEKSFFDIQTVDDNHSCLIMNKIKHGDTVFNSRNLSMDGFEVFKFVIKYVPKSILSNLKYIGITIDELENVIFHQANKFIVETLNKKIKIEPNKSPVVLDSFGNTGSCSIPLVITEKMVNSKKCFMSSFGVGLSYANCFVDLSSSKILKTKYSKNG